jgi:predicted nucleotidyltransferase
MTMSQLELDPIAESVRQDVRTAVGILSSFLGVRRIWLFGSLSKGRQPDFRSDMDLAVEGLASKDHVRAWGRLEEALQLPPDLVRWEEANETLRTEITRWGSCAMSGPEPVARASLAAVDPGRRHRELMVKMFVDIPGVRPSVLPETTGPMLNDLRTFRHIFRHGYDFQLDASKLNNLVETWRANGSVVLDGLTRFASWLLGPASQP